MTNAKNSWNSFIRKEFPWGTKLATRAVLEMGFTVEENLLVAKYLKRQHNVLILGSGIGREARPICEYVSQITCVDIVQMYLICSKKLFEHDDIKNVNFVMANMQYLPFAKESFDFVFYSLYNYAREEKIDIFRKIHHILRSNGFVLVSGFIALNNILNELLEADNIFSILEKIESKDHIGYSFFILQKRSV